MVGRAEQAVPAKPFSSHHRRLVLDMSADCVLDGGQKGVHGLPLNLVSLP